MAHHPVCLMSQRSEWLRQAEQADSIAQLCRELGISRKTFYKWRRRYLTEGLSGLADRSRARHHQPHRIAPEVEQVIVQLRRRCPHWGPTRLQYELKRQGLPVPSPQGIQNVLVRYGLNGRLPRPEPAEPLCRWERAQPNELWQCDIKGPVWLGPGQKYWPINLLDDHSRFWVGTTVQPRARSGELLALLEATIAQYGVPEAILTDNGPPFVQLTHGGQTRFQRVLQARGIRHLRTRLRHPQTLGKLERLHRTQEERVIRAVHFHSFSELQQGFEAYRWYYNYRRPHQGIGNEPPVSRYPMGLPAPPPPPGVQQVLPMCVDLLLPL